MSRGGCCEHFVQAAHAECGDASASREQGPREAGRRPTASRSRLPERKLYVLATFHRIGMRLQPCTPVAAGEMPLAINGPRCQV
jgi:hypothetical protein